MSCSFSSPAALLGGRGTSCHLLATCCQRQLSASTGPRAPLPRVRARIFWGLAENWSREGGREGGGAWVLPSHSWSLTLSAPPSQ